MKKTIICSIPMKEKLDKRRYENDNKYLDASEREVVYPINAMLEKSVKPDDELMMILIVKKASSDFYKRNIEAFKDEFNEINETIGAKAEYKIIETDFVQEKAVYYELFDRIIDELENQADIIADVTYGPKDVPIILFYALNFAGKFLDCNVEKIIYGQAEFKDNKPYNTKICDMTPLFKLGVVTNTFGLMDPDKAREMLKVLLSV